VTARERGQARDSSGEGHASLASIDQVQAPGIPFDKVPAGHVHFVLAHSATPLVDVLRKDSWIVDSGATVHVVNDFNLLTDPVIYDVTQPLTVATTDATAEIVATGDVILQSVDGCVFTLRNVKYVPSAANNLLSVSAFLSQGGILNHNGKGEPDSLSGPENWSCRVKAVGGLYTVCGTCVLGSCKVPTALKAGKFTAGNPSAFILTVAT
jgi:hypothetical protein